MIREILAAYKKSTSVKSIIAYNVLILITVIFLSGCENSFPRSLTTTKIAITIDDLPIQDLTSARNIINVFKKHNIPEVYGFLNGKKMYQHGKLTRESRLVLAEWVRSGNALGNHTFSHDPIYSTTATAVQKGINKNEQILESISKNIAEIDYKVFRYPFLDEGYSYEQGVLIRNYLISNNYKIAHVSLNIGDWIWAGAYERCLKKGDNEHTEQIKREFISYAVNVLKHRSKLAKELFGYEIKHILLLHMSRFVSDVLDELIIEYKNKGVVFVGLHDAMSDRLYRQYKNIVLPKGVDIIDKIIGYKILNKENFSTRLKNINNNAPQLPITLQELCN